MLTLKPSEARPGPTRPGRASGLPRAGAFLLAAVACAAAPTAPQDRVPNGSWGGVGVELVVVESGARAEFDCARGTLPSLLLDAEGSFAVGGTFVLERPGPSREDQPESSQPARYSGQLDGDTLTFTVTLTESGDPVGTFTATRGKPSQLRKCV